MIKKELREQAYYETDKIPKKSGITALWVILTIAVAVLTFALKLNLFGWFQAQYTNIFARPVFPLFKYVLVIDNPGTIPVVIKIILWLSIYLFLKFILTRMFCRGGTRSIKFKILEGTAMPVCLCKEALKVWQTLVIYLVPNAVMYLLFICSILFISYNTVTVILLLVMSVFMAFDLTLVIYVLHINAKEDIDYISIDHHIYAYTIYNKTYAGETAGNVFSENESGKYLKYK